MNLDTRRNFLKLGFLSTSVFVMSGCDLLSVTTPRETIKILQYDLFPKAKELNIDTINYMDLIFRHPRVTQEEKTFLKNGVKWLNETSFEMYDKSYTKLPEQERQDVLNAISQTQWGENFISKIMSYILEAMLGDPLYGGNNKEAGWKWLAFEGGKPRPKVMYL